EQLLLLTVRGDGHDAAAACDEHPRLLRLRLDRGGRGVGGDHSPSSFRQSAVCSPSAGARPGAGTPNSCEPSACVAPGPTHTSSASNNRSQSSSGAAAKTPASSAFNHSCSSAYCCSASSGRPTSSHRRVKNFGSSAATVTCRPSAHS